MGKRIGGEEAMKIIDSKLDEAELLEKPSEVLTECRYNIKEAGKVARRLHAIPINFGRK